MIKSSNKLFKTIVLSIALISKSTAMDFFSTSTESKLGDSSTKLDPNNRPNYIKQRIESSFSAICTHNVEDWINGGRYQYDVLSHGQDNNTIDSFLKSKISDGQKELHILDIGAGNFTWGRALVNRINKFELIPENFHVHIYSLTGETFDNPEIKEIEKCTLYEFGSFNFECLDKEFEKKGIHLNNKIDLAVSSWAFYYMHDPIGNFQMVINSLKPLTGLFLIDKGLGEILKLKDQSKNILNEREKISYLYTALIKSGLDVLIMPYFDSYVIKKKNDDMIFLSFSYDPIAPSIPEKQEHRNECFNNPYEPDTFYIISSDIISEMEKVKYLGFNGSHMIYNELKKYNPKFYDKSGFGNDY